ncbi:hypothetical protein HU200_001027 [Digitaria exilis]|uniref:Phytocyanin domain-containing protein n=1 Tax=Digitaria exilis TaxID=1010633 RepID=A0A835G156_9POAL|nr:hypothetical protein HU200_001027 [Digitaria exilis]
MASLRLASFSAATCTLLLGVLAASASSSPTPPPTVQRDVGDEAGYWTAMVPPSGEGNETLTQWAESQPLHVGDISRGGTGRCSSWRATATTSGAAASPPASAAVLVAVGGGGGGNASKFELDRPGTFYFVSGMPGRCEAGQKMAVRVVFFDDSGDDTTAPPPPPATVVFKVTTSAWLWVATVGVFVAVLLFVIIFCYYRYDKLAYYFLDKLSERNGALPSNAAATV